MESQARSPATSVPARVWSGTRWLVLGRLYGSLCTLIALWWIARVLDEEAFGRYGFYLSMFVVLDTLCDFGTGQYCVQRSSADDRELAGLLHAARRLRLLLASAGSLAITALAWAYGESGIGWVFLASLYPLTHALELSTVPLRNRIDWRIPVLLRISAASLSLLFVLLLGWQGVREPALYLLGVAAGSTLGNFLLHRACRPWLPRLEAQPASLIALLSDVWPLGLASLCQQAYFHVDALFVRSFCGASELGPYHIAMRVMSYSIMVAIFATQAALPWLSRAHASHELGAASGALASRLFLRACIPIGLDMPWGDLLLEAFRPGFGRAHLSLAWLLLAAACVYAGASLMTALVAAGARRAILRVALLALLINLAGNLLLVPRWGISGAGFMTFLTEAGVALLASVELRRLGAGEIFAPHARAWLLAPLALLGSGLVSLLLRQAAERML